MAHRLCSQASPLPNQAAATFSPRSKARVSRICARQTRMYLRLAHLLDMILTRDQEEGQWQLRLWVVQQRVQAWLQEGIWQERWLLLCWRGIRGWEIVMTMKTMMMIGISIYLEGGLSV